MAYQTPLPSDPAELQKLLAGPSLEDVEALFRSHLTRGCQGRH